MDDTAFALSADLFVLHQAGIRQLLPAGRTLAGEKYLRCEPWAAFLAKLPPAPLMVWTYRELGSDLSGRADPARRALWRELIKFLGLPRGSVAFWPFALPAGPEGDAAHMEPFLAGLVRIAPKALVIFGEDSQQIPAALAAAENDTLAHIRCFCAAPQDGIGAGMQSAGELADALRQFLNTVVSAGACS